MIYGQRIPSKSESAENPVEFRVHGATRTRSFANESPVAEVHLKPGHLTPNFNNKNQYNWHRDANNGALASTLEDMAEGGHLPDHPARPGHSVLPDWDDAHWQSDPFAPGSGGHDDQVTFQRGAPAARSRETTHSLKAGAEQWESSVSGGTPAPHITDVSSYRDRNPTLFRSEPSTLSFLKGDPSMSHAVPTLLGMAINHARKIGDGTLQASDSLSKHSSPIVKRGLDAGVLVPNPDNRTGVQNNGMSINEHVTFVNEGDTPEQAMSQSRLRGTSITMGAGEEEEDYRIQGGELLRRALRPNHPAALASTRPQPLTPDYLDQVAQSLNGKPKFEVVSPDTVSAARQTIRGLFRQPSEESVKEKMSDSDRDQARWLDSYNEERPNNAGEAQDLAEGTSPYRSMVQKPLGSSDMAVTRAAGYDPIPDSGLANYPASESKQDWQAGGGYQGIGPRRMNSMSNRQQGEPSAHHLRTEIGEQGRIPFSKTISVRSKDKP